MEGAVGPAKEPLRGAGAQFCNPRELITNSMLYTEYRGPMVHVHLGTMLNLVSWKFAGMVEWQEKLTILDETLKRRKTKTGKEPWKSGSVNSRSTILP